MKRNLHCIEEVFFTGNHGLLLQRGIIEIPNSLKNYQKVGFKNIPCVPFLKPFSRIRQGQTVALRVVRLVFHFMPYRKFELGWRDKVRQSNIIKRVPSLVGLLVVVIRHKPPEALFKFHLHGEGLVGDILDCLVQRLGICKRPRSRVFEFLVIHFPYRCRPERVDRQRKVSAIHSGGIAGEGDRAGQCSVPIHRRLCLHIQTARKRQAGEHHQCDTQNIRMVLHHRSFERIVTRADTDR